MADLTARTMAARWARKLVDQLGKIRAELWEYPLAAYWVGKMAAKLAMSLAEPTVANSVESWADWMVRQKVGCSVDS
jgi:hypothetical protein